MISRAASAGMSRRPMSLPTSSRARFMAESRRRPVPAFISRSAARTMAFVRSPSSICDSASLTRRRSARRRAPPRTLLPPRPCRGWPGRRCGRTCSPPTRRAGRDRGPTRRRSWRPSSAPSRPSGHRCRAGARFALAHLGHALERPQEGVEIRHRPALRAAAGCRPASRPPRGRHHRRDDRDARRSRRRRRGPRRRLDRLERHLVLRPYFCRTCRSSTRRSVSTTS